MNPHPRSLMQRFLFLSASTALIFSLGCGEETDTAKKKKTGSILEADTRVDAKVIYGEDGRVDLFEVTDPDWANLARSTVALVDRANLLEQGDAYSLQTRQFKNQFRVPLCSTERFYDQETAAFCSGFLVKPNVVITAGHCVQTQGFESSDCATTRFVFGFAMAGAGQLNKAISKDEVYSCKRIIQYKLNGNGADYSVVELDRAVPNHEPLKIRRDGTVQPKDEVVVIGHPSGLPAKLASGAQVRTLHNGFFRTDLDTFGGNSGSAVFNAKTREVEGILVRGEVDFVVQGGCTASKVCSQNSCRGEDVTFISEARDFLESAE